MRHFVRRRSMLGVATLSVAALALAGCAADDSGTSTSDSATPDTDATSADCDFYADYLGHEGETVEIYTSITGVELDQLVESTSDFVSCTGIDLQWNGTKEFEGQLPIRAAGGTAPDLAVFPQPGLLQRIASESGAMVPLSDAVAAAVAANYPADWVPYGEGSDGTLLAAPLGANVKSFVWYSPKTFADNGWDIPSTWNELLALSDEVAADGNVQPWCVGFGSGDATGWVGTDWMEDLMLRFADGETYDQWVSHEIPFNDPAVLTTIQEAGKILKNADYVGNVPAIATTMFDQAPAGLVTGECAMHRQASFASGWFGAEGPLGGEIVTPDQTDVEGGVSVFYFPGVTADQRPALAAGEFIGAFSDAPAVEAVQLYLTTAQWNNTRASLGGWISTHNDLDPANIDALILRESVEILKNATLLRFDASDLMPGNVGASPGAGTFWGEMTAWVANDKSDQAVLDSIEAFWSASE